MSTQIYLRNFKKSTLFQTYPNRNKGNCSSQSTPNRLLCLSSCIVYHPTRRMSSPKKNKSKKNTKNSFHFFFQFWIYELFFWILSGNKKSLLFFRYKTKRLEKQVNTKRFIFLEKRTIKLLESLVVRLFNLFKT